jgi:hypothetical protein
MRIIPFESHHVEMMELREPDRLSLAGMQDRKIKVDKDSGEAWTGMVDEGVVACGGIIFLWPGVGWAWLLTGTLIRTNAISFHKAAIEKLKEMEDKYNLHRIQCSVNADYVASRKWLEKLGFTKEGLMKKYDTRERDYYMYARVRNGRS